MLDLGRTFLQSLERNPNACALVDDALRLSYAQWGLRIGGVQQALSKMGLRRGDHLLSILQNRHEAATLHWACQFIGVVVTPLNWRVKPDEIGITDRQAQVLAQLTDFFRCGVLAQHEDHGITDVLKQHEGDEGHHQHDQAGLEQPAKHEHEHARMLANTQAPFSQGLHGIGDIYQVAQG